jgi:hypothetical protein
MEFTKVCRKKAMTGDGIHQSVSKIGLKVVWRCSEMVVTAAAKNTDPGSEPGP